MTDFPLPPGPPPAEPSFPTRPLLWLRFWRAPIVRLIQYGMLTFGLTLALAVSFIAPLAVAFPGRPPLAGMFLLVIGAEAAAAVGALWLMAQWRAGPTLTEAGLTRQGATRETAMGIACGLLAVLALAALGALLRLRGAEVGALHWNRLAATALLSLLVGIAEEVIFRGFALPTLERKWGTTAAWVGSSLLFGAVHLSNPGVLESPAGVAATFLGTAAGGLVLGATLLLTRRLWLPIGLHAGWDTFAIFASGKNIADLGKVEHYNPADLPGDLLAAFILLCLALLVARTARRRGHWRRRAGDEPGKIMP